MIRTIARPRSALTLVEVLVSLMILSVVGTAMVGVLMLATNLYQRGESSRGASDETMAVLAQFDADLAHMVPRSADGWLYAKVADTAGNCVLAFTARHETSVTLDDAGIGLTQTTAGSSGLDLIVWWTTTGSNGDPGALSKSAVLCRAVAAIPANIDPRSTSTWFDAVRTFNIGGQQTISLGGTSYGTPMTIGCLHFSTWFTFDDTTPGYARRTSASLANSTFTPLEWESRASSSKSLLPPFGTDTNDSYDSDALDPVSGTNPTRYEPVPWPLALRVACVLTGGGRHVSEGRLIGTCDATSTALRVGGLGPVPEYDGHAFLRIENEWVRGTMSSGGWFNVDATTTTSLSTPAGRGARRSAAVDHNNGAAVVTGWPAAIVRSLPR